MNDKWNRKINYMRISVTDRCNLRCCYCMPEVDESYLPPNELLTFNEIEAIVKAGISIGIDTLKITGGEPLLRKNIVLFIKKIKGIDGIRQVTLTTNGVLLEKYALELKDAGIDSININLPALTKEKYASITRRDEFIQVMAGIRKARDLGLKLKINCVSRKTMTDDELYGYGMIARKYPIDVRFIEIMPIGYGKNYDSYSNDKILDRLNELFGEEIKLSDSHGNGPATYYEIHNFIGKIGLVSAVSHKFCDECNRIRLSADGYLKLCLNYNTGISLKECVRNGNQEQLKDLMNKVIYKKPQCHNFYDENTNCNALFIEEKNYEMKYMAQIGG